MTTQKKFYLSIILAMVAALTVRLLFAYGWASDFWGDSYHHWLISRLTLAHPTWEYSGYKGMEVIWLPTYHYLILAAMMISGRFDLWPAYGVNIVLGSVACGLVVWLTVIIGNSWRIGLVAGLTLALIPWYIAYSATNMPEILAGVLLLLVLLAAWQQKTGWLFLLALISVLTRYELALLLSMIGLWLVYKKDWPAVSSLSLAIVTGLSGWSLWVLSQTGHPLWWWAHALEAIAWDARFWDEAGVRLTDGATLLTVAQQTYPPLPIVLITGAALVLGTFFLRQPKQVSDKIWLCTALVAGHWLTVGLNFSRGYLPTANPRYLLITLPLLVCVGTITIAVIRDRAVRLVFLVIYGTLLLASLYYQLPVFLQMSYVLTPEKAAGEALGQIVDSDATANFWVDAPVTIYYSKLDLQRFFSSDYLLPAQDRYLDSTTLIALAALEKHNIQYILWEDVSYSFVNQLWPQMATEQPFEQHGYRFEPIFRYSGWELDYGATPTILWYISSEQGSKGAG